MIRRLALLFLLATACSARADSWVPVADGQPGAPRIEVTAAGPGLTRIAMDLPGYHRWTETVGGREHARLSVPGAWPLLVAGAPELPHLTVQVPLPPAGAPRLRVVEEVWREASSPPVVPSRGPVLRSVDPLLLPRVEGPAYAAGVHPATAQELGRPYVLRGRRGVGLSVHPLRWDADRQVLLVLERLVLEVETTGDGGTDLPAAPPAARAFAALHDDRFGAAAPADKYAEVVTGGRMLIVTAPEFVADLQPFAQWKRERGLLVEVATAAELGGTADGILAAVLQRYSEPAGLTYLVLAGDVAQVPTHPGLFEGADNDTRYAMVEGDDLYPDLFVSRVSARTRDELLVQLNKFIRYERDPEPGAVWYDHAVGVASILGDPTDAERADALRDRLLDWHFAEVDRMYEPAATAEAISEALNQGRSLLNYLGHGSGVSWSNPAFGLEQVAALDNGHRQPWIVDVSCANGRFSSPECFAESWLRTGTPDEPRGAIAMYSASTTTPWIPPTLMQEEVVDLLVTGRALEIGALCQHGIMKVLDAYPGDIGRQLVEQYNILGDCSLQVRTRSPRPVIVEHAGSLAVGVPVFAVQVDTAGAVVAVTAPGRLLGAAVTDDQGRAVLLFDEPPLPGEELTLTVSGADLLPHRESLTLVQPLTAAAVPAALPVGAVSELRVDLTAQTGAPAEVDVSVAGWGVTEDPRRVASAGSVDLTVRPVYGEDLHLWVRDPDTGQPLFHGLVPVIGAIPLVSPSVGAAVPAIGMTGTLAPGTAGRVWGTAGETGLVLGLRGEGVDTLVVATGDTVAVQVVPAREGRLTAALLKAGRTVHEVEIRVVPARGTVSGHMVPVGGGVGVPRTRVRVTRVGETEPLLDVVTDDLGWWSLDQSLPVGEYVVHAERYGYLDLEVVQALLHGDNSWELELTPAPPGAARGRVFDAVTGLPLAADVAIHRLDTGQNVATALAGGDGSFVSSPLPVGWFMAVVRHPGHRPLTTELEVTEAGAGPDLLLTAVAGRILVVGDNAPPGVPLNYPPRLDKHGEVDLQAYTAVPSRSAAQIWGALLQMGYTTDVIPAPLVDLQRWSDYDLVVVACGDNPQPLADAGLRLGLEEHLASGGRLLLEGGDVAAVHGGDGGFARRVLHIAAFHEDGDRNTSMLPTDHAVAAGPAALLENPVLASPGYAGADEVIPAADAAAIAEWEDGAVAAVAHDQDGDQAGGQVVFLPLDLGRLLAPGHDLLLQNSVEWLLARVPATAGLAGRVVRADGSAAQGARVTLWPGGRPLVAGRGGVFSAVGLVPGEYRMEVGEGAAVSVVVPVTLVAGSAPALQTVVLPATATAGVCTDPALAIPDNDPTAAAAPVVVDAGGAVTAVRLCVTLDHAWPDDLTLDLTAPSGHTVRLRHRGDAWRTDPAGCYDSDAEEGSVLREFLGAEAGGAWLLRVTDTVALDTGTLMEWCLEVDHAVAAASPPPLPRFAWLGNHPNPFNPRTTFRFTVPRVGAVEIGVFDVRGRRVRTLPHRAVAAGLQSVTWDGRDGDGRELAGGVYLVRVGTGAGEVTGKVLLLR